MSKTVLLDTSILVRERAAFDLHHSATVNAVASLIQNDWTLCLAPQCLIEFWAVVTRPREARSGLGMSPSDAQAAVDEFITQRTLLPEPANLFVLWYVLIKMHAVSGRQVWDARIVAWMQAYGVSHLLTCNPVDLTRYTGISAFHPDQVEQLLRLE